MPSHNDIAVYKKMGVNEVFFDEEKQHQKEYLRSILERKKSGEMTSLEASQFLEIEGIPIPTTLLLEIKELQGSSIPDDILSQYAITSDMTPEEAAETYKKMRG